jgi:S1-C subfamily serine protease
VKLNQENVKTTLRKAIRSVGRVEVVGYPGLPYGGTGFVVGDGLLMTNRHVAELFTNGLGENELTFISGRRSLIDFARDPEGDEAHQLRVRSIKMIHPYWDMALLQVDGLSDEHSPLSLLLYPADEFKAKDVAVVGYPAFDPRNPSDVQQRVFGGIYNVKRLLPGKGGDRRTINSFGNLVSALVHDASTLGGNSGSAVIDPISGSIVGLHFAGVYLDANFAVPSWELAKDSRVVDAGVLFGGAPPIDPEVTRQWWHNVLSTSIS